MQAMVASLVAMLVAGPVAAQSSGAGQPGGLRQAGVFRSGVDLVTVSATVHAIGEAGPCLT